jgi:putative SOS response-associated peptidase YedK
VHNQKQRMPAILADSQYHSWLLSPAPQAHELLRPYSDESMRAWKVSRRVNNRQLPNDERLIAPLQIT